MSRPATRCGVTASVRSPPAPATRSSSFRPYMIRLSTQSLAQVGRSSGFIIAASTVGSIAGVFVSGFVLIDQMKLSHIFRVMGGLTVLLGLLCVGLDRWLRPAGPWTGKESAR